MRAPSTEETDAIVASFGPNATAYLSKYPKSELFTSYSRIVDSIITSQGAEAAMNGALVNKIRCVEPTAMLHAMANTQRLKLAKNKSMAAGCTAAVPPRVEERIAVIIIAAKKYPSPVPVEGTNQMEWDVLSLANTALRRRVVLSQFRNTPPQCCAYSQTGSGFPCNHGAAVILEKHGAANMHKFISKRHLTGVWKEMYEEGLEFKVPQQHEVDAVMLEAQKKWILGSTYATPRPFPHQGGAPARTQVLARRPGTRPVRRRTRPNPACAGSAQNLATTVVRARCGSRAPMRGQKGVQKPHGGHLWAVTMRKSARGRRAGVRRGGLWRRSAPTAPTYPHSPSRQGALVIAGGSMKQMRNHEIRPQASNKSPY